MSVSNVEKIQLKIMYLFMNVDGTCGEKEVERFDAICDELKASKEDKNEIIKFMKDLEFTKDDDNSELVINAIGTLLGYIKEPKSNGVKDDDVVNNASFRALHTFCVASKQLTQNLGKAVYAYLINKNKVRQAHTVWTLINLGYADTVLVSSERKVIEYLVSVWKMDEALSSTLFDTAETILALQLKKDWVLSTDKVDDEKDKLCAEIDTEMKKMYDDVELTISEANI